LNQGLFTLRFRLRSQQKSRLLLAGTVQGLEKSAAGDFFQLD
jgi:hypothetical protein